MDELFANMESKGLVRFSCGFGQALREIQENPDLNVTIGKQVKVLIFSTKESKLDMFEKCLLEIQGKN